MKAIDTISLWLWTAGIGALLMIVAIISAPRAGRGAPETMSSPVPFSEALIAKSRVHAQGITAKSVPVSSMDAPAIASAAAGTVDRVRFATDRNDRLEAIELLGDFNTAEVVMLLRLLLDDPDASIRAQAVESLGAVGGSEAVTGLGYALTDDDPMSRHLAVEVLAEIGSEEAVAALALVMNDPHRDIRELAAERLKDIGSPAALPVLQRFTADEDWRVRETAAEFLAGAD